jgi:uncharacterized Rmd1/YagE family protein
MAAERRVVHVYGFASNVRPAELLAQLAIGEVVPIGKTVARANAASGMVFAFDFGALVFFGFDEARREAIVATTLSKIGPEPHPPLRDDYALVVDAALPTNVAFDRAELSVLDDDAAAIIALVLAQSVSLDYYDEDVGALFRRVGALTGDLARDGKLRGSSAEVQRTVGAILVTRSQIVESLALLDAPPQTWDDERLDGLYRAMRRQFEIVDRYAALEAKLSLVQQNLLVLVDLMQHRRAEVLELVVVGLIAVELVLAIVRR